MKWIQDPETGELLEPEVYHARKAANSKAAFFMPDIAPFISPIDGSEITSRSALRAHERRHGVRQVGNDLKLGDYNAANARCDIHKPKAFAAAYREAVQKLGL